MTASNYNARAEAFYLQQVPRPHFAWCPVRESVFTDGHRKETGRLIWFQFCWRCLGFYGNVFHVRAGNLPRLTE